MSTTLSWKLNRLKAIGPAEVCWRVRQGVATGLARWGFGLAHHVEAGGSAWVAALPMNIHAALYVEPADRSSAHAAGVCDRSWVREGSALPL